jgi:hypothetical protein
MSQFNSYKKLASTSQYKEEKNIYYSKPATTALSIFAQYYQTSTIYTTSPDSSGNWSIKFETLSMNINTNYGPQITTTDNLIFQLPVAGYYEINYRVYLPSPQTIGIYYGTTINNLNYDDTIITSPASGLVSDSQIIHAAENSYISISVGNAIIVSSALLTIKLITTA